MARVPWLERTEIASRAEGLLREYAAFIGEDVEAPVPVEAIIERYLGIRLLYDDLKEVLGIADVLGATWVDRNLMIIHSGLLDGIEGRLSFTCAHEVGHWILHRELVEHSLRRENDGGPGQPTIVCRKRNAKLRGEWQADCFAACLLMPEEPVRTAFLESFGPDPLIMHNRKSCFGPGAMVLDPALDTAKEIALRVVEAGGFFNVSKEAMRYRLEELGLLINMVHGQKLRG
jgi:Zn-dependent peptidase ImmA (M78 family)